MKKGFTLAEILIVLTIIGVMAVMTIPSLMQNSNSQQKITLFKKGFNALSNAYATEFAVKSPPKHTNDNELMWSALNNQLNVKYYVDARDGSKLYTLGEIKEVPWLRRVIVTEDEIGYLVSYGYEQECESKLTANSHKKTVDAEDGIMNHSCFSVVVLLDKKYKLSDWSQCVDSEAGDSLDLNNLKCSTLTFWVTKEGVTAGNPDCTISGRIISGVNPRPATCNE